MIIVKRMFIMILSGLCFSMWGCSQNTLDYGLTDEEMTMPEAAYYSTDFAEMPDDVAEAVANGPIAPEDVLAFEDIGRLAEPGYLPVENGYCVLKDNTAFVAVKTDFPNTKKEMIHWWFSWHALKSIRYKIWYPGYHYAISVKDADQLTDQSLPPEERYLNNRQYPMEDVGAGLFPISIKFVSPESFGFDTSKFESQGIEAVICAIVGFRLSDSTIEHTYMCHLYRKKGDGLEQRSRFWLGKRFPSRTLRKLFINEQMALDMMLHCSGEYTHLASFLPDIYDEFSDNVTN
ncbi:MAG: hypothetical protein KKD44_09570 [Proteobacteria bacterium]|nr:hypothetical protein [Pseudomonadota bacterium]